MRHFVGIPASLRVEFQFTHPGRGATPHLYHKLDYNPVSIHAPREGCDHCPKARSRYSYCFNSRTPGGVRLYFPYPHRSKWQVSIHAPREGCDVGVVARPVEVEVSIHAPREGCDRPLADEVVLLTVSIHAPREGCDRSMTSRPLRSPSFNSRTPGGVRRRRLP